MGSGADRTFGNCCFEDYFHRKAKVDPPSSFYDVQDHDTFDIDIHSVLAHVDGRHHRVTGIGGKGGVAPNRNDIDLTPPTSPSPLMPNLCRRPYSIAPHFTKRESLSPPENKLHFNLLPALCLGKYIIYTSYNIAF